MATTTADTQFRKDLFELLTSYGSPGSLTSSSGEFWGAFKQAFTMACPVLGLAPTVQLTDSREAHVYPVLREHAMENLRLTPARVITALNIPQVVVEDAHIDTLLYVASQSGALLGKKVQETIVDRALRQVTDRRRAAEGRITVLERVQLDNGSIQSFLDRSVRRPSYLSNPSAGWLLRAPEGEVEAYREKGGTFGKYVTDNYSVFGMPSYGPELPAVALNGGYGVSWLGDWSKLLILHGSDVRLFWNKAGFNASISAAAAVTHDHAFEPFMLEPGR